MRTLFHPLPRKQFEKLAEHKEPFCTSIYIPMFKSGKELNQGLSEAYLKSSIKESVLSLKNQGMADKEAELYVEPLKKLLSETDLWRNPVDGLAIFLSTQYGLQYYRLPIRFEVQYYVSDHFLLLPLLAMYEPETSFYLLALSQDHVKLYEGNTFELRNIPISELAPQKLEDTVGSDYEQKMLQVRSGHMQYEEGSFHGHGEGKDDESKEVKYFFREINKMLKFCFQFFSNYFSSSWIYAILYKTTITTI